MRTSEGSDYTAISTSGGDTIFSNTSSGANNIRIFNGGSERMRIDSTGALGIGTSTPSGRLHIKNSAASNYALRFAYADGTDGGGFYESTSTDLSLFLKDSTGTTKTVIAPDGDSYFNGGNLGIGTSSPSAKLEVNDGVVNASDIAIFTGANANRGLKIG